MSCGSEVKLGNKFCNNKNKCKNNYYYKTYIDEWLDGKQSGERGSEHISTYIRRFLIEKYGNKCQKCGWSKINEFTKKVPLEIHHMDGNWKNNRIENLQIICPCCHALTENYRASGTGSKVRNGREGKRKFYQENKSSRWIKKNVGD